MLGFFNNAIELTQLRNTVIALRKENEALANTNKKLVSKAKDIEDEIKAASSEVMIDFTVIRCFSIERRQHGYTGKTILGYNLLNDVENHGPREWILYCNEEQHQKLIDKFKLTKENNGTI